MVVCEGRDMQSENESDRNRQNPDMLFDDRISKNNIKLYGKKF